MREDVVYVPIEIEPAQSQFSTVGFHPSLSVYKELGRQVAAAICSRERLSSSRHALSGFP